MTARRFRNLWTPLLWLLSAKKTLHFETPRYRHDAFSKIKRKRDNDFLWSTGISFPRKQLDLCYPAPRSICSKTTRTKLMTCAVLSKCDGYKDMIELSKSLDDLGMVGVGTTEISHTSRSSLLNFCTTSVMCLFRKGGNRKSHDLWSSTKVHYFGLMIFLSRRSSSSIVCRGPAPQV